MTNVTIKNETKPKAERKITIGQYYQHENGDVYLLCRHASCEAYLCNVATGGYWRNSERVSYTDNITKCEWDSITGEQSCDFSLLENVTITIE